MRPGLRALLDGRDAAADLAIDRMGNRVAAAGRAALPADDQEAALGTAALGALPEVDAV